MTNDIQAINDSILNSVKKLLGLTSDYTPFDPDIIMHINSVLSVYVQMGIGPEGGFMIEDNTAKWSDFLGDKVNLLQYVKSCTYLKVKLLFDPPNTTTVMDSIHRQISELEWRMYTEKGGY